MPYYNPSLVLENNFESGNPPSENQYFSTFQIPLEPRLHPFNENRFPLQVRRNQCYTSNLPERLQNIDITFNVKNVKINKNVVEL